MAVNSKNWQELKKPNALERKQGSDVRRKAAFVAEPLERVSGNDQPVWLPYDDDGRREGARRPAPAAVAISDDARQRHLDLGKRHVPPARQQAFGNVRLARSHSVLQRRPSAAIMASASRGPHSPAS